MLFQSYPWWRPSWLLWLPKKLTEDFHPAILRQYTRIWKDFLIFQVAAELLSCQVTLLVLLPYLEYLANAQMSGANISNNMATLRAFHIIHGLPTDPFRDQRILLFLKSIKLGRPFSPKIASVLTLDNHYIQNFRTFPHFCGFIYFLLFSFLLLSNLLQHTTKQFGITRYIARGDIIFT